MGETIKDSNNALFTAELTADNVVLVCEGVVEDLYRFELELDDEEWEWEYQEDDY